MKHQLQKTSGNTVSTNIHILWMTKIFIHIGYLPNWNKLWWEITNELLYLGTKYGKFDIARTREEYEMVVWK